VFALPVFATVLLAGLLVLQPWRDVETYETGVGEQRLVVLKDGSRMSLNTSTRVRVEFDRAEREVSVEVGEALFHVAKDESRPFTVQANGVNVTATGTAFVVQLVPKGAEDHDSVDVTLVEGQVVVRGGKAAPAIAQPIVMSAGDRLRLRGDLGKTDSSLRAATAPQRERPRMDQVLAWTRGEVIFDNVSLQQALVEMNRYSSTPILAEAGVAELRVSGVFRAGDNVGFARAVAALHGLSLGESEGQITLTPKQGAD
jgi:transmembrane sensor